jgi:hypothetical protein
MLHSTRNVPDPRQHMLCGDLLVSVEQDVLEAAAPKKLRDDANSDIFPV